MKQLNLFWKRFSYAGVLLSCIFLMDSTMLMAQKKKSSQSPLKGYGAASYTFHADGAYMKEWLLAGPVILNRKDTVAPDMESQVRFFDEDGNTDFALATNKSLPSLKIKNTEYPWRLYSSKGSVINLDSMYSKVDYASAYALAEITTTDSLKAILAVGSDDGVKVWLNGKLIHNNWMPRGLTPDADVIPVSLAKGKNLILIKVQDVVLGWGFTARFLDRQAISERLVSASGRGDMDEINSLIAAGADLKWVNEIGLSALSNAKLQGREDVVNLLRQKGAIQNPVPPGEVMTYGLYKSLLDKKAAGVAVLVAKDGKVLYKNGFGYADIEANERVTPETKFRIGSVTKQFTASAILKLQEEGRLKLTDKLDKYFPGFPRGNEVTIHHLLNHTSGIHSYTGKDDFVKKVVAPITSDELVNYFKNDPYDFNPGDAYRYNNSGYFLAALIVEKVSGKSYGEFLDETFFKPLQMKNTGVHSSTLKLSKEAKGYTKENNEYKKALDWNMSWAGGAGALYSTVEDLHLWNEAVFNGKVLNEQSLKLAFTAGKLNNGDPVSDGGYGYGWGISNFRGEDIVWHSGGLHGFASQLARYTENDLTVVILTNLTPSEVNLNPNTIAEYFLWDKLEKQRSYSEQASAVTDPKIYEGRYDFKNGAVMIITAEENNLFAQLSGQSKFPIFPAGEDEFFWKVVEARIKFVKDEKGEVTHGNFTQNGMSLQVPKLKEEAIVTVDPALYKTYVGNFDYGNNMIITVTTENDKIFVQATNQPKFEIFPVSEKEYVVKDIHARISFVTDESGKTTTMIVDMAGQKKEAPKVE